MLKDKEISENFDQPQSLMLKTLQLCKDYGDPFKLHYATGIPFYWLRSFIQNKFKNPSVNRIQYLYEKLTDKKLEFEE